LGEIKDAESREDRHPIHALPHYQQGGMIEREYSDRKKTSKNTGKLEGWVSGRGM